MGRLSYFPISSSLPKTRYHDMGKFIQRLHNRNKNNMASYPFMPKFVETKAITWDLPRPNGHNFVGDYPELNFLIFSRILRVLISKDPFNNKASLVQVKNWHQKKAKSHNLNHWFKLWLFPFFSLYSSTHMRPYAPWVNTNAYLEQCKKNVAFLMKFSSLVVSNANFRCNWWR